MNQQIMQLNELKETWSSLSNLIKWFLKLQIQY